ncbi:hypothetical protein [Streptomyces sp. 7-21]|jgi:hypothetical protein|uniref:hypothetical protein n=1 Tax=Streptomyces sp. 7-21 TaxID=2802283 RepID=UPI00191E03CA|nr:hypothetical protein [Streptomyces sp. 7-21]MBL1067856.1 hypothetical protein [Streptomyces sp. 7-21]
MTRGQRVLWWLLLIFGVLLAVSAGTALWAGQRHDGDVRTDTNAVAVLGHDAAGKENKA